MSSNLRRIQSGDLDDIGYAIYNIASTWTAAGFVKQANRLLSAFWKYKSGDQHFFHNIIDGFVVMWNISGQKPAGLPIATPPMKDIVQSNWDGLFSPDQWHQLFRAKFESKPWNELTGRMLAAKATLLCYEAKSTDRHAPPEKLQEGLKAWSKYLSTEQPVGYDLFHSTTCAAIVAANLGEKDKAIDFIEKWGLGYLIYPENYMLGYLMSEPATARYLQQGILAPVWGITDSSCNADLHNVEAVLAERMAHGRSLVFGGLTLKDLLQRLSDSAISQDDSAYEESVKKSRWLGYAPALSVSIESTEKRLNIALPEDYKAFLMVTNGFRAVNSTGVSFLPVEKIGWTRDLDSDFIRVWGDPANTDDPIQAARLRRSLLIGGVEEEQQFLLVPPVGKDKGWQYWFFANWLPGIQPFPSLRYYLEYKLQTIVR